MNTIIIITGKDAACQLMVTIADWCSLICLYTFNVVILLIDALVILNTKDSAHSTTRQAAMQNVPSRIVHLTQWPGARAFQHCLQKYNKPVTMASMQQVDLGRQASYCSSKLLCTTVFQSQCCTKEQNLNLGKMFKGTKCGVKFPLLCFVM